MKSGRILVTGATGNVGSEVINLLKNYNSDVIAGVRDVKKGYDRYGDEIEYVTFDFTRPETYGNALKGVDRVFLVRPPQISKVREYMFPFIDFCKQKAIKKIVFLSLLGVEKNPVVPHHKIEKYIKNTKIPYTFLRASFFMQNLNTIHREDIKKYNKIFVPAGKGKTSFIDVRDIAEVGVKALTEEGHNYKAYALTGEKALDYFQVANIFSKVLDRKIEYTNPSIVKFFWKMKKRGIKTGFVLVMIALYTTARLGLAKKTTNETEKLLGRKPISLEKYVKDHKECWI